MTTQYITTPIYYVNDKPHIGHAYTTIACDVLARFYRLLGDEVKFLTGTDEHGQKVDKSAQNRGIPSQQLVDEVSISFKELVNINNNSQHSYAAGNLNKLNISNDDFIRTTEERHKLAAQEIWRRIENNGHIYKGKYAGYYSVRDEAYYQESELIDGKAPTGAEVEWVEEESYFFDLSKWQDNLLDFYDKNPNFVQPKARFNEVYSFVKGGLKDLSISRTNFNWGVTVPANDKRQDNSQHVMYVWLDALTNYLTAAGFPDDKSEYFVKYWDNAEVTHIVGKDILRFHAVYWPAFLMAAKIHLPKRIIAHGWWTIEGEKMSKSIGNVISPDELLQGYGLDFVRYFFLRAMPFGNDGDFAKERILEVTNAELANNIGNLCQRTLSIIHKNFEDGIEAKEISEIDKFLLQESVKLKDEYINYANDCHFSQMLEQIAKTANIANKYIDEQKPWELRKNGQTERLTQVLVTLCEMINRIAILLSPVCPAATDKILLQLGLDSNSQNLSLANYSSTQFINKKFTVNKPEAIFPRVE